MKKLILNKSISRRPSVTSNGVRRPAVISSVARNLFLLSALAGLMLSGCDCKDCIQNDPGTLFNVTPNHLLFTEDALQKTFSVSSSMDWTLITMPEGFIYSVTKGKPGLTVVTVTMTDDFDGIEPVTVYAQASNGDTKPVILEYIWPELEDDPNTKDPDVLPGNVFTYVGAFWRANETGERIIRIKGMYSLGNNGAWTASVTWLDGRWGKDRVVLRNATLAELTARGIYSNAPGNAQDYPVVSHATKVTGTANEETPDIIFRAGVTQPFTTDKGFIPDGPTAPNYTTTWPARYGIITITYNNNAKSFKLYLRQGEGADYVMRPGDPDGSGNAVANNRAYARRFSPYNLTDPDKSEETVIALVGNPNNGLPVNGGGFVQYPTQVGHYFQFNRNRQAFLLPPGTANPENYTTWNAGDSWCGLGVWNPSLHETCPVGWRRPQDGSYAVYNTVGNVEGSEFRQSLWQNPPTGISDETNSPNVFSFNFLGYYADGFFDRREIYNATSGGWSSNPQHVTVFPPTSFLDLAARGFLFVNPITNASLFFPLAGNDGSNKGWSSLYRSATGYGRDNAWQMVLQSRIHIGLVWTGMISLGGNRAQLFSVRCVREALPD